MEAMSRKVQWTTQAIEAAVKALRYEGVRFEGERSPSMITADALDAALRTLNTDLDSIRDALNADIEQRRRALRAAESRTADLEARLRQFEATQSAVTRMRKRAARALELLGGDPAVQRAQELVALAHVAQRRWPWEAPDDDDGDEDFRCDD